MYTLEDDRTIEIELQFPMYTLEDDRTIEIELR
jgi:hypothetical protein